MRNTLRLDTSGFEEMIRKLDRLGGDVRGAVEKSLSDASEKISNDTINALGAAHLPAAGKYSDGDTKDSVITDNRVRWDGTVAWVPVGFDFTKPGAGGFLISGTPRMSPDPMLNRIYKGKAYMRGIQVEMSETVLNYIVRRMEE